MGHQKATGYWSAPVGCILGVLGVVVYTVVITLPELFVPDKYLIDAEKVAYLADRGLGDAESSFSATAAVFQFVPDALLQPAVWLVGAIYIMTMFYNARSIMALGICLLIIGPSILLNLIAPTKETLVIMLSVIVLISIKYSPKASVATALVSVLYLLYALTFRTYYLLIILAWLALSATKDLSPKRISIGIVGLIAVLFIIPIDWLVALQGARDHSNSYALSIGSYNRTMFYNIVAITGPLNFLLNYIYAAIVLNIPFLIAISSNEIVLALCAWACLALSVLASRPRAAREVRVPSLLFLSHLLVLWLFEPDLGSYLRHFTSVSLYLAPALSALSKRAFADDETSRSHSVDNVALHPDWRR